MAGPASCVLLPYVRYSSYRSAHCVIALWLVILMQAFPLTLCVQVFYIGFMIDFLVVHSCGNLLSANFTLVFNEPFVLESKTRSLCWESCSDSFTLCRCAQSRRRRTQRRFWSKRCRTCKYVLESSTAHSRQHLHSWQKICSAQCMHSKQHMCTWRCAD